jgi:nucleoside-diphosphate-sugar epimerase
VKILLLGANGFIGPSVIRALTRAGHVVVAVARTPRLGPNEDGVAYVVADRGNVTAIANLMRQHKTGSMIDLLAMTNKTTKPLVDAISGRIDRYVLISSCDVYQRYGALHRKEMVEEKLSPLQEDDPIRTSLYPYRAEPPRPPEDPQSWWDDYDKIPIEEALLARNDLKTTIVRLPMVYGPGDKQRRFRWVIEPMIKAQPVIEIDEAWAAWRTSYGYVDDIGVGIALAATHPAALGGIYNVGPKQAPDHSNWFKLFAAAIGWSGEFRNIARTAVEPGLARKLDSLDLSCSLAISTDKIRSELAYTEVADPTVAIQRTVEDEIRNGTITPP